MAVNYTTLLATVRRLIQENGRSVTVRQLNQTPPDVNKPWNGPADPRAVPAASVTADAVMVEPSSLAKMGLASDQSDLVLRSQRVLLVAPPTGGANLAAYHEVVDDGEAWRIEHTETLRPANTTMLFILGLNR